MSNILIKKEKSVSVCELWIGDENIRCVVLVGGLVAWVNAGEKSVLCAKWREGVGVGGDHVLSFPAERVYDVLIKIRLLNIGILVNYVS
jgi:hypothetical protein